MEESVFPYPGYSWSITQHVAPATNVVTMFELLKAASTYSRDKNYQEKITDYMIEKGFLTPNIRKDQGKPQLWRDYQQILPELGLIVSTRFTSGVEVTPIGLMWLDGIIGYSELLTTQCLNYQYPNGHKQDLSPVLKKELSKFGFKTADSRTILDAQNDILIKPAALILRILLELIKSGQKAIIDAIEVVYSLMPIKRNDEWRVGLERILDFRKNRFDVRDTRRTRHVQEWFRLLSLTDIFSVNIISRSPNLGLSDFAISNLDLIERYCEYHEDLVNYWIPSSSEPYDLGWSWFRHFGSPNIESQWALDISEVTAEYVQNNYPDGYSESGEGEKEIVNIDISLNEFKKRNFKEVSEINTVVDESKYKEGRLKLHEKSRLHDDIVERLANRLQENSYQIWEDRQSVDLLASKDSLETIFEVKTVSKNNFSRHVRLGVGQLLEYRYRREIQSHLRPQGALVLSSGYHFPEWMKEYFQKDLSLGILTYETDRFRWQTDGVLEKSMNIF